MGYSWPGVFLLGASGRTGRFSPSCCSTTPVQVTGSWLNFFSIIDSWQNACIGFKQVNLMNLKACTATDLLQQTTLD